jgi:hypothetical protein
MERTICHKCNGARQITIDKSRPAEWRDNVYIPPHYSVHYQTCDHCKGSGCEPNEILVEK